MKRRRRSRSAGRWLAAAVVTVLGSLALPTVRPNALGAQTVLGTAVDEAAGAPVAGAFVLLLDAETGVERDRVLTTRAGTFRLATKRPGTYRLSLQRIGFETLVTDPFPLADDEVLSRRLQVTTSPIELSGIEVTGGREPSQCGTPAGEAVELSRVWAEARKALEATAWTDRQSYYRFDALLVRQALDEEGTKVGEPAFEPIRIYGRHPFRSVQASDLAYGGWVQQHGSALKFYAPDAEVLLSDSFLRRHCFRLVRGDSVAPGLLGIEFEPRPNGWVSDIDGVLWVDRATAELRRLDYAYVNVDLPIPTEYAGGNVQFDQLPDGSWIVQSWEIRTPAGLEGQRVLAVWRTGDLQADPQADVPAGVAPVQAPPDEMLKRYPAPPGVTR
ncbi:MAG: carboxypeptidase-like regulatory domain-containing protein [Gemmatimonadales bacterium]|jgi:hypothetical protein